MSQAAQNILGQDVLATQQSQSNDVQVLTKSSDHKYQVMVGKFQSLWKLLEDDDDDDDVCYQTLLDAIDKMTMDKVAQAAASKDVDERTQGSDGFDTGIISLLPNDTGIISLFQSKASRIRHR